jgi:hypothetical protein
MVAKVVGGGTMAFDLKQEQGAIEAAIAKVSTEDARDRLRAELNILSAQHASTSGNEQECVQQRLLQLRRDAEIAAGVNLWSWASIALVAIIVVAYFGGVFFYMWGLGPDQYSSIEGTRPILVFTLIVAMLGFGGLLIVRALFSNDSDERMQTRFRLAREVFLVFSGIFGTIIGFYFGAADEDAPSPPSLSAPAYADGRIDVAIEGGRAPFITMLTLGSGPGGQVVEGDDRTISFVVAGGACPDNASLTVVDGEGRRDEAELVCPGAATAAPPAPGPQANEAANAQ